MQYRTLALGALLSAATFAACSDSDNNIVAPAGTATVRFVNATGNPITVTNAGVVPVGSSSVVFGTGSACMLVNAGTPTLTFTNVNTGATITGFSPAFTTNGNVTIVAFTDANGNTQFATLDNSFAPASGDAGLRVFNAANGSGNIVLSSNGTILNGGAATAFGNSGVFFDVPAGTSTLTFDTGAGTTTLATLSPMTLIAGQNTTVILGPAAPGSSALRAFVTTGC